MIVTPDLYKIKTGGYSRSYILDIESKDDILKFESNIENIHEGIFSVKLDAFFQGGTTDPDYGAPPIAYVDANVLIHGLHKIYNLAFTQRPSDRPTLGSLPQGGDISGYVTVSDSIESLVLPSADPDAGDYESMFFYTYDSSSNGYFVQTELIVNLSANNPIYFRWGSAIADKYSTLLSSQLRISKL